MTEAQRHQILLEMLAQLGFVTVEKVVERLGISPATARRAMAQKLLPNSARAGRR